MMPATRSGDPVHLKRARVVFYEDPPLREIESSTDDFNDSENRGEGRAEVRALSRTLGRDERQWYPLHRTSGDGSERKRREREREKTEDFHQLNRFALLLSPAEHRCRALPVADARRPEYVSDAAALQALPRFSSFLLFTRRPSCVQRRKPTSGRPCPSSRPQSERRRIRLGMWRRHQDTTRINKTSIAPFPCL